MNGAAGEVCIANLGPKGRRTRLLGGLAALAGAGAAFVVLVAIGAPRFTRLLLVLPLWMAVAGVLQAREAT